MAGDDQAAATKQDIRLLMEEMGKLYQAIAALEGKMNQKLRDGEERLQRHVDVRFEEFRHDFLGAQADRMSLHDDRLGKHEQRITRLESDVQRLMAV